MRQREPREGGAAVVEFVLMSVLLIFLLFGVLQVALFFYARNIVAAAAADAARYAANAGVDPAAGSSRAAGLIASGLNRRVAAQLPCTSGTSSDPTTGLATVTVHCRGRMSLTFLPVQLPMTIDVQSSALQETALQATALPEPASPENPP